MKMKYLLAATAVVSAGALWAEDGDADSSDAVETPIVKKAKFFSTLPVCAAYSGEVSVRRPGSSEWEAIETGRRYALGTEYSTSAGSSLSLSLGPTTTLRAEGSSRFATRPQKIGEDVRSVLIKSGVLNVSLPRNLPPGAFSVAAPGFTVKDMAGESRFSYTPTGDGDDASLRCLTGTFSVDGRNFTVPAMNPTHEIRVRTSHDNLNTILYGVRGDSLVKLDRGIVTRTEIDEDGKVKNVYEKSILDWKLSPMTRAQINRVVPAIGSKLGVSVMTFDAEGILKNNFAYTEECAAVNSGELVPASKEESEKLAKRAAEATSEAAGEAGGEGEEASGGEDTVEDETNEQEEE